jgi:hypothetical protein
MAGIRRCPWAAACGIAEELEALADVALVPADDREGGQGRHGGLAVVPARGSEDGCSYGPGGMLVVPPGSCLQMRDHRLVSQVVRQLRLG